MILPGKLFFKKMMLCNNELDVLLNTITKTIYMLFYVGKDLAVLKHPAVVTGDGN